MSFPKFRKRETQKSFYTLFGCEERKIELEHNLVDPIIFYLIGVIIEF